MPLPLKPTPTQNSAQTKKAAQRVLHLLAPDDDIQSLRIGLVRLMLL